MFRQTRLVPGSCVPVNKPLVDCLVDQRDRRVQKFGARILVRRQQCRSKLLDLRTQLASVASVDLVALNILSNAFFS